MKAVAVYLMILLLIKVTQIYCQTENCASNPCQNEALCEDTNGEEGYQCFCVDGFAGQQCDVNFDDCTSAPCKNNGTCTDGVASYMCACQPGFTGQHCEMNIDECLSNFCEQNGTCIDLVNGYVCQCQLPFKGDNCNLLPCETIPCENEGLCQDDLSFNQSVSGYICDCILGFTGLRCNINIEDCDVENDTSCNGNGLCIDGINDYSCLCEPGWVGDFCQSPVDDCIGNDCRHNSSCVDHHLGYTCTCSIGYDGDLCEREMNECFVWDPCKNGATCIDAFNDYRCECDDGWSGKNCSDEINECLTTNPCKNGALCLNNIGGFVCRCPPFYTDQLCETLYNPCDPEYNQCQNEANCLTPPDGQYRCFCPKGFTGTNCEVNMNECLDEPCLNNGTCEDITAGYICHCMEGWTGQDCDVNIDECLSNPCANEAKCFDLHNAFECNCTVEYTGRLCEEMTDFCQQDPCFHDGTCFPLLGDFRCKCLPPYTGERCLNLIDECESSPCLNNGTCMNTVNGFLCNCPLPYTGNTCAMEIDHCASKPCLNGGTCNVQVDGFICNCPAYLTGRQCTDLVDHCENEPCKNGAVCINDEFKFRCICSYGFTGLTCIELIDFCVGNPCQNSATCSNIPGGYKCDCSPGFTGDLCQTVLISSSVLSSSMLYLSSTTSLSSALSDTTSTKNLIPSHSDIVLKTSYTFASLTIIPSTISLSKITLLKTLEISSVSSQKIVYFSTVSVKSKSFVVKLSTTTHSPLIQESQITTYLLTTSKVSVIKTPSLTSFISVVSNSSRLVSVAMPRSSTSDSLSNTKISSTMFSFIHPTASSMTNFLLSSLATTEMQTSVEPFSDFTVTPLVSDSNILTASTSNVIVTSEKLSTSASVIYFPNTLSTFMENTFVPSFVSSLDIPMSVSSSLDTQSFISSIVPKSFSIISTDITSSYNSVSHFDSISTLPSEGFIASSNKLKRTTNTLSTISPSTIYQTGALTKTLLSRSLIDETPSKSLSIVPTSLTTYLVSPADSIVNSFLTSLSLPFYASQSDLPISSLFSASSDFKSSYSFTKNNYSSISNTNVIHSSISSSVSHTFDPFSSVFSSSQTLDYSIQPTKTISRYSISEPSLFDSVYTGYQPTRTISRYSFSEPSLFDSVYTGYQPTRTISRYSISEPSLFDSVYTGGFSVIETLIRPTSVSLSSLNAENTSSTSSMSSLTVSFSFSSTIDTLIMPSVPLTPISLSATHADKSLVKFSISRTLVSFSSSTTDKTLLTSSIHSTPVSLSGSFLEISSLSSFKPTTSLSVSEVTYIVQTSISHSDNSLNISEISTQTSSNFATSSNFDITMKSSKMETLSPTPVQLSTTTMKTPISNLSISVLTSKHSVETSKITDITSTYSSELTDSSSQNSKHSSESSNSLDLQSTPLPASPSIILLESSSSGNIFTSSSFIPKSFISSTNSVVQETSFNTKLYPSSLLPSTLTAFPSITTPPLLSALTTSSAIIEYPSNTTSLFLSSKTSYPSVMPSLSLTSFITTSVDSIDIRLSTPSDLYTGSDAVTLTKITTSSSNAPTSTYSHPVKSSMAFATTDTTSLKQSSTSSSSFSTGVLAWSFVSPSLLTSVTPTLPTSSSNTYLQSSMHMNTETTDMLPSTSPLTQVTLPISSTQINASTSQITMQTSKTPMSTIVPRLTSSLITTTRLTSPKTTTPTPTTRPSTSCDTFQCQNNGTCRKDSFGTFCDCLQGFTGEHCDTEENVCKSIECENGGYCSITWSSSGSQLPRCNCRLPFTGTRCDIERLVYYPSFIGSSYMRFSPPTFKSDQSNEVYLSVKTIQNTGSILYSANDDAPFNEAAFIHLFLEGGKLKYTFSCDGLMRGEVTSDNSVNTGDIYDVVIRQVWSRGPGDWCSAALLVNTRSYISSPVLSLGQSQPLGHLFIGGAPRHLTSNINTPIVTIMNGFIGCIHDLQINTAEVDMVTMATDDVNIENCNVPVCQHNPCKNGATCHSTNEDWYCTCPSDYGGTLCDRKLCGVNPCNHGGTCVILEAEHDQLCLCPYGRGGVVCEEEMKITIPRFSGDQYGYSSFIAYSRPYNMESTFEIQFKMVLDDDTSTSNMIMYMGNTGLQTGRRDYMVVALYRNFLVFKFDLGSGVVEIYSAEPVNNTIPVHHVVLGRSGSRGWIKVDNQRNMTGVSGGRLSALNTNSPLYVGGYDSDTALQVPQSALFDDGLKGCVFDLSILTLTSNFVTPGSPPGHVETGRNVRQCDDAMSCDRNPCHNGAVCVDLGASIFCNCTDEWKGTLCLDKVTVCDIAHTCATGSTCIPDVPDGYRCLCPLGQRGTYCDEEFTISDPLFVGEDSYMSFTPVYIKKTTDIKLQIKPSATDGLVFYVAQHLHSNAGDFLSIVMNSGKAELRFDLGTGINLIQNDREISKDTDKWYTIKAGRNATHGYISVDGHVTNAMTTDMMSYLDTTTAFYLGGMPRLEDASSSAFENDPVAFEGCIREFVVNGKQYELTEKGALDGQNIDDCDGTICGFDVCKNNGSCSSLTATTYNCTCTEDYTGPSCELPVECVNHGCVHGLCVVKNTGSYSCDCFLGWTDDLCDIEITLGMSVQLSGASYLNYIDTNYEAQNKSVTHLTFSFKTSDLDGMLIWNGQTYSDEEDYLGIGVYNGRIKVVWNLGWYTRSEVTTTSRYHDDKWHDVSVKIDGQALTLTVDSTEYTSSVSGDFVDLDTHGVYYIGGFKDNSVSESTLGFFTEIFNGCVKNLILESEKLLSFDEMTDGRNVNKCNPS